jgi:hypothetical protein
MKISCILSCNLPCAVAFVDVMELLEGIPKGIFSRVARDKV